MEADVILRRQYELPFNRNCQKSEDLEKNFLAKFEHHVNWKRKQSEGLSTIDEKKVNMR
jgi:hypothetical protein